MFLRLMAVAAALLVSLPVFAQELKIGSNEQIELMLNCGEVETAKHILIMVPIALLAAFSPEIVDQLGPYETAMATAKTCEEFDAAYKLIAEVSRQNESDPEVYFASPEGKAELEEMVTELSKLKAQLNK